MGRRELQDVWERFVGPGVGTAVLQVASSRFGEIWGGEEAATLVRFQIWKTWE